MSPEGLTSCRLLFISDTFAVQRQYVLQWDEAKVFLPALQYSQAALAFLKCSLFQKLNDLTADFEALSVAARDAYDLQSMAGALAFQIPEMHSISRMDLTELQPQHETASCDQ